MTATTQTTAALHVWVDDDDPGDHSLFTHAAARLVELASSIAWCAGRSR